MAYLGNDLQVAFPTYRNIDDISGSFNGVTTSFPLTVDGVAPIPAPVNSQQCLISVNGVVQRPDDSGTEGFRLSGGNIIFAAAPAGGVDFFGVILAGADYINVGANFPSGTNLAPSITFDSDLDTGIYNPAGNHIGFTTAGIQRVVINSSGQLSSGLGSAAAPAVSFISDPNTGIYSPGADQVAISTGGTGRLFVDASGNVGIGTSPSYSFHLTSTEIATNFVIDNPTRGGFITAFRNGAAIGGIGNVGALLGDTTEDLGIYAATSKNIRFYSGGVTERMRLDSSGRLGLGTNSPAVKLDVAGGINSSSDFSLNSDSFIYSYKAGALGDVRSALRLDGTNRVVQFYTDALERARIDSSGRLLIGTSSARSPLTHSPSLQVEGLGYAASTASVIGNSNDTNGAYFFIGKSRGTSLGANTVVQSGDELGGLDFLGADGSALLRAARITALVDGTPGTNDMPGRLVFSTTADGASSPTERMRIDSSGRVGIGVTDPGYPLDLLSNASAWNLNIRGRAADNVSYIRIASNNNATTYTALGAPAPNQFAIDVNGSERVRIDSSGRLLVGTSTSPSAGLGQYARISAVGYTGSATGEGIMTIARGKAATSMASGDTVGQLSFTDINGNDFAKIVCSADATPGSGDYPGVLTFSVTRDAEASPTEALRITNGGETRMRCVTAANGFIVNHSDTARNVYAFFEGRYSTTDNTGGTGTRSYIVYTSGDVRNVNNSYGAISDLKLKENIVDANSQWDDLKALQVRNYNFKEGQTHTQIGLIAQEVELVSPGLVTESPDRDEDGNDLGTTTKSVNYSVLYMKAVKALQEAMERIEVLEAKVNALEGN